MQSSPVNSADTPVPVPLASNEPTPTSFDSLPFVAGDDAVSRSGLLPGHVAAMQTIAEDTNVILMFRPVNPLSTGLLEEGAVAKGMHIKAKTSDWGPMAGFIPSDPRLSKKWKTYLSGGSPALISDQMTGEVATSFFVRRLVLAPDRLRYLSSDDIQLIQLPAGRSINNPAEGLPITILARDADRNPGDYFEFRLIAKDDGNYWVNYRMKKPEGQPPEPWAPVQVLHAYVGAGKMDSDTIDRPYHLSPITADYDAFAYAPHLNSPLVLNSAERLSERLRTGSTRVLAPNRRWQFSKTPVPINPHILYANPDRPPRGAVRFRNAVNFVRANHLGQGDRLVSKPNIGREPSWQAELRERINQVIGASSNNNDLVRHATEMDNVFVPEQDDHILIITPDQGCYLTKNWTQVQAAIQIAQKQGFVLYTNRNYNREAGTKPIYRDMTPRKLNKTGTKILFEAKKSLERLLEQASPSAGPSNLVVDSTVVEPPKRGES